MNEIAIIPRGFAEVDQLAEKLSKSSLLPDTLRNKPQDVMFQIMAGAELGLAPIASIRGIYIIQGKPTLSADTMVAICLGSGHCEYFAQIEASATSVTFETKRKGSPVAQRVTWTWEDAKRASLNTKQTWREYPRQMLASRAKAELARLVYSDLLSGVYSTDEIEATPAREPLPAAQALARAEPEAIEAEIVTDDLLEQVTTAATKADLEALKPQCMALPSGARRTVISQAYGARDRALTVEPAA